MPRQPFSPHRPGEDPRSGHATELAASSALQGGACFGTSRETPKVPLGTPWRLSTLQQDLRQPFRQERHSMQEVNKKRKSVTVFADNRHERDDRLEAAVASLRDIATELRIGILVTRVSPQSFTVTVSPLVPFGMTREVDGNA